jgi:hypothetical protein
MCTSKPFTDMPTRLIISAWIPSYISIGAGTVVITPYICYLLISCGLTALVDSAER